MNMHSLILRTAGHFLLPLLLLFSVFLLLRGHDEPGGGFIGGLVAAAAILLYLFSMDTESARKVLRVDPRDLLGAGMVLAVISAIPGVFRGQAFFTAQWWEFTAPIFGEMKLSTVLIFDIGVYLVVIGSVLTIMLNLAEAED
ncbi:MULTISPECIES: Na+/H+ antiporter subunit B [Thioalkalivibrio]|uniref:Monovalent cation/H+ antiporter subunit B n=1 Tax=Thioalkalivibrio versutus TaxID=106634 RepID=A0A0G3G0F6_9GAMM|nr:MULTISPECIES: Na+/H+ antiporter subunit B [Thioalkalivibrio]AKJ94670.1 monovalent cation/H+ antiporter subunit B [Thioalkalivibrio versutus]OOC49278.1 Na(+)/H(+) antiporter subunit B [Thioalkalivibrio versutus]